MHPGCAGTISCYRRLLQAVKAAATKMKRNKQNTPVIIKFSFWKYTAENPKTFYPCINLGEAYCPVEISDQSLCIDGDIEEVLRSLM